MGTAVDAVDAVGRAGERLGGMSALAEGRGDDGLEGGLDGGVDDAESSGAGPPAQPAPAATRTSASIRRRSTTIGSSFPTDRWSEGLTEPKPAPGHTHTRPKVQGGVHFWVVSPRRPRETHPAGLSCSRDEPI
jgi:hypothetical protein